MVKRYEINIKNDKNYVWFKWHSYEIYQLRGVHILDAIKDNDIKIPELEGTIFEDFNDDGIYYKTTDGRKIKIRIYTEDPFSDYTKGLLELFFI
ncbi:MAG: hypothetical protein ACP5G1_03425 [Nanopusillaceae archaeon]